MLINCDSLINDISVEFENLTLDEVQESEILTQLKEALKGDSPSSVDEILLGDYEGADLTPEASANLFALAECAEAIGATYEGNSFNWWATDECYVFVGPSIFSNGSSAVIEWGKGNIHKLSGPIKGRITPSGKLKVKGEHGEININLRIEASTDALMKAAIEKIAECETWEQVKPFLHEQVAIRTASNGLYDHGVFEAVVVDGDLKEGQNGLYWIATLKRDNGEVFAIYLPERADVAKGKTILIDGDSRHLILDNETFTQMAFLKSEDLEVGKTYTVIEAKEATGQFPGLNLTLKGEGLWSANSQFQNWYNSRVGPDKLIPAISPDKTVSMTVSSKKKQGPGYKLHLILKIDGVSDKPSFLKRRGLANRAKKVSVAAPLPSPTEATEIVDKAPEPDLAHVEALHQKMQKLQEAKAAKTDARDLVSTEDLIQIKPDVQKAVAKARAAAFGPDAPDPHQVVAATSGDWSDRNNSGASEEYQDPEADFNF